MSGFPFKTGFSAQSKYLRMASNASWYFGEGEIHVGMALPPHVSNNDAFRCQAPCVPLKVVVPTASRGGLTDGSRLKADSHIACRAHAVPLPCRAVNSHMLCRAPAMLRQCRILRERPRGKRKYPNRYSNSLTDRLLCSVLLPTTFDIRRYGSL
jgi:hypothetical protein